MKTDKLNLKLINMQILRNILIWSKKLFTVFIQLKKRTKDFLIKNFFRL